MSGKTPEGFSNTFFEKELKPYLPEKILDFHTHIWEPSHWYGYVEGRTGLSDNTALASAEVREHQKYMATTISYRAEDLIADAAAAFPGLETHAVVFGQPTPKCDHNKTNAYAAASAEKYENLYALRITGTPLKTPPEALRREMTEHPYYGYKVYLNWLGDQYPPLIFDEMLTEDEFRYADENGLIVLLHVPRAGRLADPEVGESVRRMALRYPGMKLVLAHCGRCYRYEEIRGALHFVSDLDNVWFDCSMVMDPAVMAYILQRKDPRKMLFATDCPVAAMRGRRVTVADHWVDLVLPGYPESHYRVISDNMRASFMIHEIAKAAIIGAELAGLTKEEMQRIFFANGMELLLSVRK